jgi:hypothetical protein
LEAAIDRAEAIAPEAAIGLAAVTGRVEAIVPAVETVRGAEVALVAAVIDPLSAAAVVALAVADRASNGDLATGRAVLAIVLVVQATGIVPAEAITTSSMVATISTRSSTGRIGIVRTGTGRTGDGAAAVAGPGTGMTTASDPTTAGTTAAGTVAGEVTGTLRSPGALWVGGSAR